MTGTVTSTLTGGLTRGLVEFTTNTADGTLRDPAGNVLWVGPKTVRYVAGEISVVLPATDDAAYAETDWQWCARVKLDGRSSFLRWFALPGAATVDLADIAGELTPGDPLTHPLAYADVVADIQDPESVIGTALAAAIAGVTPVDIYVAASGGSNGNDGLARSAPKATLAGAITALGSNPGRIILMAGGGSHPLAAGVTIDVNLHSVIGQHGAVLDASSLTGSAVAIALVGTSGTTAYTRRTRRGIQGVELVGPGKASSVTGIRMDGGAVDPNKAVAHLTMSDVAVHDFGLGVEHSNNNYLVNLHGWDIYNCGTCVDAPSGTANSGEGIRYWGGTMFNSDLAVRNLSSQAYIEMYGVSLDYNSKQVEISGGRVGLHGCHIEAAADVVTVPQFSLTGAGANLRVSGGSMIFTGATPLLPYVVDNESVGGRAVFDGVFMHNTLTTSDHFATGSGITKVIDYGTYNIDVNSNLLGPCGQIAIDGSFEATTVRDEVVFRDEVVTSRLVGALVTLTTSTDQAQLGSRSLKMAKTGGAGAGTAQPCLAYPVQGGRVVGHEYVYRKAGAQTGTVYLINYFVALRYDTNGIPSIIREQEIETKTVTLSAADTGWVRAANKAVTPEWATHMLVLFVLDSMAAGNFYVDDVLVTQM